jgi:tRNA(Arg) A34 adenosine deaminase TadA
MNRTLTTAVIALSLFLAFLILSSQIYRVFRSREIDQTTLDMLVKAGATALESSDVPVGAVIVYRDSVIASGYNTVRKDSDVAAHAEINAINEVIRKLGFTGFSELERDDLFLISTYEPCGICRNAILEYNIRNVLFLKEKSLVEFGKQWLKTIRYHLEKRASGNEEIQDSLFRLHPAYPAARR